MKQVLPYLSRAQTFLVTLAVLAIISYTAYQISLIFAVFPDATAIETQKQQDASKLIRFNPKAIEAVKKQVPVEARPSVGNPGKSDPFSP
ncbi:hypothetical protein KY386_01950 [Candidatus Parcubacteria bacterium]|nr:hypothetical protein [Candidatus Parcubacteria bacterium]